jgi:uncharacterized protein involved in exopolysaccharide biosynthesis
MAGREQPARRQRTADEDEPLVDTEALFNWARLVPRAVRRRKLVALSVFVLTIALVTVAAWSMPTAYRAHVRILASPLEGAPGTVRPQGGADKSELAPAAVDVVRSHEVLRTLVHEEHLADSWERTRPLLLRYKDALTQKLTGHAFTEDELEEAVAFVLEKRVTVSVADHVVDIGVSWPEPDAARRIVERMRKSFLDSRTQAELTALRERSAALDAQVESVKKKADATVAELTALTAKKRKGAKPSTVRGLQAEGRWRDLPDPQLSALRTKILNARKAIAEREDVQRKRIAELKAQYAEQSANLGPNHPALLDTADKLSALNADTSDVDALRRDEEALVSDFVRLGGRDSDLSVDPAPNWPTELMTDDPQVTWLKTQMDLQSSALASAMRAAVDARVAAASAEAQVPERYTVLQPALTPREPVSVAPFKLIGGGVFLALLLSAFAAVFVELRRGKLEESWQVERWLGIPTLAVVRSSRERRP